MLATTNVRQEGETPASKRRSKNGACIIAPTNLNHNN